jgi:hypothetical protein
MDKGTIGINILLDAEPDIQTKALSGSQRQR